MTTKSALQAKLEDGLLAMGLLISAEKQVSLIAYLMLIDKWNKVHNLTAVRDPLEMVTLHLLDSLSVLPHVEALAVKNLLDVGAGAGLPSIPLAICLPELQVTAIDSVQKKTSFMRQVKGELGLSNFHIEAGRVETLERKNFNTDAGFDVIISRAFSEIGLFVKLTKHLLAEKGCWLAMKGIVPEHEFANQAFKALCLKSGGIQLSKIEVLKVAGLDAKRHLVFLNLSVL
ncbi:MAG: 16S rRNA (guanine(527)-N(7))-methyltransferase RsmG [Methylotenera sp.]|nr:16S rRNA (guanine(527)-N(7))-methyltransferase RsmG [Methylotenera sp.]MSP99742.1 16S rRNA (guanine(527)-N(7))-methyltransferase RsmG [Methylotenera sp.]